VVTASPSFHVRGKVPGPHAGAPATPQRAREKLPPPPPLTEADLTALLTPTPTATDVWSALGISQSDFAAMRQTISSQQAEIGMLRGGFFRRCGRYVVA
jgi:hypothetical protein